MNYLNYSTEDFVLDNYFRKWVNRELPQEDSFWETWIVNHPEKQDTINQALIIIQSLHIHQSTEISEEEISSNIQKIMDFNDEKNHPKAFRLRKYWMQIAASIAVICGLATYFYSKNENRSMYNALLTAQTAATTEKVNTSDKPVEINLGDGSQIILEPKSKISYPNTFAKDKREVYLDGEAFFKISKNPNRPFYVYAHEIVTKVLGTSFSVKAFAKTNEDVVKVYSGKVSVQPSIENKNILEKPFIQTTGVILTPNQMVVFDKTKEKLTRTLVENPVELIKPTEEKVSFNFENASAASVFNTLSKAYGIEIVYDEDVLKNCQITAPLGDESLYEKLNLICSVIRANYEVVDAQIIINSKGCN